ncbi:hypothetical protein DP149_10290 [Clostridium tetani]|nr:hypothetical protein KY52_10550 [Clostridium tetani]KGI41702.1 hypothetical protein KY54_14100 [Clostridium tetani]KIG22128.1 hypothetical protein RS78_00430 [Clostridium tetani]RXI58685.1 hypothetical protein DP125_11015 [Clostridium tetani]RXI59498.1 hypothetical protein DP132_12520 [Clostridium tetani]
MKCGTRLKISKIELIKAIGKRVYINLKIMKYKIKKGWSNVTLVFFYPFNFIKVVNTYDFSFMKFKAL